MVVVVVVVVYVVCCGDGQLTLLCSLRRFNFGDEPFKHPPTGPYAEFAGISRATAAERAGAVGVVAKGGRTPVAVILEPSRELAEQTHAQLELFRKNLPDPGVRSVLLIGGGDTKQQIKQLQAGADIIVGTPGRIADFLNSGKLDVSQVGVTVWSPMTSHLCCDAAAYWFVCSTSLVVAGANCRVKHATLIVLDTPSSSAFLLCFLVPFPSDRRCARM